MQIDNQHGGSRKQIIRWVNSLLGLKVASVEQLGTGAVYCQLLDILKPGIVTMNKVNWKAKQEYQCINNFKVLQIAVQQLGIDLKFDVEKLVKCRYQDNFQLIQSLKKLIDKSGLPQEYNPTSRRSTNPELPQKKNSTMNKENAARKESFGPGFPLTVKASESKRFQFPLNTSSAFKSSRYTNPKRTVPSFLPNKEKSDQDKLRMIREILQRKGEKQLQEIKSIVFQGDSEVEAQEEADII